MRKPRPRSTTIITLSTGGTLLMLTGFMKIAAVRADLEHAFAVRDVRHRPLTGWPDLNEFKHTTLPR